MDEEPEIPVLDDLPENERDLDDEALHVPEDLLNLHVELEEASTTPEEFKEMFS